MNFSLREGCGRATYTVSKSKEVLEMNGGTKRAFQKQLKVTRKVAKKLRQQIPKYNARGSSWDGKVSK